MPTLHESGDINYYSNKCKQLWDNWNSGPVNQRVTNRKSTIKSNHILLMNRIGIKQLDIQFVNQPGVAGQFSWGDWTMEIGPDQIALNNITCEKFIALCATLYHETRHAEQFTRIAQGIRLGRLQFPGGKKLPLFGKTNFIANAMGMDHSATSYALNHRNDYLVFVSTPRKSHCIISHSKGWDNWDPTVDSWMERTYQRTKSTFSSIGQSDDTDNLPNIGGQYSQGGGTMDVVGGKRNAIEQQFYFRAEDELDAYAIEKLFTSSLQGQFPQYTSRKNWARNNPGWGY